LADQKDRLGDKFRDVEAAREDQWARKRDAELLAAMRERFNAMLCPYCKASLGAQSEGGVEMLSCPNDHGAWLGKRTLEELLARK
jgi:Transcription factor zinc-finger